MDPELLKRLITMRAALGQGGGMGALPGAAPAGALPTGAVPPPPGFVGGGGGGTPAAGAPTLGAAGGPPPALLQILSKMGRLGPQGPMPGTNPGGLGSSFSGFSPGGTSKFSAMRPTMGRPAPRAGNFRSRGATGSAAGNTVGRALGNR